MSVRWSWLVHGTVRRIALLGVAAMMLAAGLLLASCAPANDEAKSEPAKSVSSKPEQSDPAKAQDVQFTEIGQKPSEENALRVGKDQISVLVLNANGVEGAAAEAAGDIEALGFKHVTVDNATFSQTGNRVSYHHEEHRAEVEEVAALFEPLLPFDPYCYEDAWSGGWSMDYDILVMVGEPGDPNPEGQALAPGADQSSN